MFVDCSSYWDSETTAERPKIGLVDDTNSDLVEDHRSGCNCSDCEKIRETRFQWREQRSQNLTWKDYDMIDPSGTLDLPKESLNPELGIDVNHRYLICTHVLGAFVLKTRTWSKYSTVPLRV
jgi:hypothetical protein